LPPNICQLRPRSKEKPLGVKGGGFYVGDPIGGGKATDQEGELFMSFQKGGEGV